MVGGNDMQFDSDSNAVYFDKSFRSASEAYEFCKNNNEIMAFIVGIMCIRAWRRYACNTMENAYEETHRFLSNNTGIMIAAKDCYEALAGKDASLEKMHRHFIFTTTSNMIEGIKIEACQTDTMFLSSIEMDSIVNKVVRQCYKNNVRLGCVFERNNGEKDIAWDRFVSVPKHGGQWLFKLRARSSKRPAFAYWVNKQTFTLNEITGYIEPVGHKKVNLIGKDKTYRPFVEVKHNGKCEVINTNDVALPSPLDIGTRVFNIDRLENGVFGKDYVEEAITFNTDRDFIVYLRAYPEKVRDTCDKFYAAIYNAAYCLYTGKGFADYNSVRFSYFRYLLFTKLSIDKACELGKDTGCINTKYKMGNTITFGDGPEGYMVDVGSYDLNEKMTADIAQLAAYEGIGISGDPSYQLKQLIENYANTVNKWFTYYGSTDASLLYKWHEVDHKCLYAK